MKLFTDITNKNQTHANRFNKFCRLCVSGHRYYVASENLARVRYLFKVF